MSGRNKTPEDNQPEAPEGMFGLRLPDEAQEGKGTSQPRKDNLGKKRTGG